MFIARRTDGTVYGVFANLQPGSDLPGFDETDVPESHPDIVAFRHRNDGRIPRNLSKEIEELKASIFEIEELKARIFELEKARPVL